MARQSNKRVTIHDVARTAGVSAATVSRALSQPEHLRHETLDHVLKVIKKTGYRSNPAAVQLRTGTSQSIMVLVSDITNAFYAEFFKGIEEHALTRGYVLLIGDTCWNADNEKAYFNMLRSNNAAGLLWNVDDIPAESLPAKGLSHLINAPFVACNSMAGFDVPTVRIDNDLGGQLAADHLLGLGHQHFAEVCGPMQQDTIKRRSAGFNERLQRAGFKVPKKWCITNELGIEQGRQAATRLAGMKRRPTAVFVHNDATAIGMLHTFQKLGLSVPGDISIIGYDDMPYASAMTPELTSVRLPRRRWGKAACDMLISIIQSIDLPEREVAIAPELVVRDSCCSPVGK